MCLNPNHPAACIPSTAHILAHPSACTQPIHVPASQASLGLHPDCPCARILTTLVPTSRAPLIHSFPLPASHPHCMGRAPLSPYPALSNQPGTPSPVHSTLCQLGITLPVSCPHGTLPLPFCCTPCAIKVTMGTPVPTSAPTLLLALPEQPQILHLLFQMATPLPVSRTPCASWAVLCLDPALTSPAGSQSAPPSL